MIHQAPYGLSRHSLRDQIRETLLKRIGAGELQPGDRIVEARLAEEFGVSSIPIREAIRELVAMRVLEFANHKGAWVRQISLAETVEGLEIKAALEALAARTSAPRLKGQCAALWQAYTGTRRAAQARNFVAYQEHNQTFHRIIVEAAGNRTLLKFWEELAFEIRTRPILEFIRQGNPVVIAREHEAIVKALEAGHARKAAELLASHAKHLVTYLRDQMAANDGGSPPAIVSKRSKPTHRAVALAKNSDPTRKTITKSK
jgi:DNA-binding GntR family transcriptional regulator